MEITSAVWSTAFINDLPDSCFALIEPGGEKDSEGKTTPRSLRHLPYKDSSGKIDLPHLRNALARVGQMSVSQEMMDKAKRKLQNVAREAGVGEASAIIPNVWTPMLKLKLFSESIELQASQTSNQYPFVATITYAGKLSDGFVGGTESIPGGPYQVLITAELLRKKIKSLAGKSVLVSDGLNNHSHNYKIGTFKQAWVEAVTLPDGQTALAARASGLIEETDDNREIVEQIIDQARAEQLGFSYDIKDVKFNLKASTDNSSTDQFVEVTDFEWRGATILRRDAAAYEETRLAASKTTPTKKDEDDMTPEQIQAALLPLLSPIQTSISSIQNDLASQKAELQALKAAGTPPTPVAPQEPQKPMTAVELAAAVAEAMKPVIEAATKKEPQAGNGMRRSVTFTGADFRSKYHFGAQDAELDSSESCQKMIDDIHASNLPNSRKERMVAELGAQKRFLQRQEFAGGAN